jgi:DNA-binding NarL/FixJ family response regulator
MLLETEPAWPVFLSEVRAFLRPRRRPGRRRCQAGRADRGRAEVLRLVADGLDNRAIAERLHKSEKTVRNQVSTIFDKLGVRTRAEAIVKARSQQADV